MNVSYLYIVSLERREAKRSRVGRSSWATYARSSAKALCPMAASQHTGLPTRAAQQRRCALRRPHNILLWRWQNICLLRMTPRQWILCLRSYLCVEAGPAFSSCGSGQTLSEGKLRTYGSLPLENYDDHVVRRVRVLWAHRQRRRLRVCQFVRMRSRKSAPFSGRGRDMQVRRE